MACAWQENEINDFRMTVDKQTKNYLSVSFYNSESSLVYPDFPVNKKTYEDVKKCLNDKGQPVLLNANNEVCGVPLESLGATTKLFLYPYICPFKSQLTTIESMMGIYQKMDDELMNIFFYRWEQARKDSRTFINKALQYYIWKDVVEDPITNALNNPVFGGKS